MKKKIMICLAALLMLAACSTTSNNLAYFRNLGDAPSGTLPRGGEYMIKIAPDDELAVVISSSVPAATAIYNAPMGNMGNRSSLSVTNDPKLATHIVDKQGCIELPVIGKITVAGRTTEQVQDMIKQRIARDVKDPYVRVTMQGFNINVMGEVKTPQRIKVNGERFTVLDALAAAGDLTEYGQRDGVLVIREENGVTSYHRMNLADSNIFASPYFYLQQNDVVYVEPNKIRVDNSKYNTNNAYKLSLTSTIVSAASVIASLVIALAVK